MSLLPTGTVIFPFTDIEGSRRLLHEIGNPYLDMLEQTIEYALSSDA